MASKKLVDGDYLEKLLSSSFEVRLGKVEDAIVANASLFGAARDVSVQTIGTFSEHAIVMNSDGQFFRAAFKVTEGGELELDVVEEISVPVFEAHELKGQVREHSNRAVDLLLKGQGNNAFEDILSLYDLVKNGVPLTAESVESEWDSYIAEESDWVQAIRDGEKTVRGFLGVEAKRESPTRRFESVISAERINDQDRTRKAVVHGLREMRTHLSELNSSIALARLVDDTYALSGDKSTMGVAEFSDFVESVDADLQVLRSVVEDAITVSDQGTIKSLARIHDGVAGRAVDMTLATSFAEKFARRFTAPQAA
jgi:hypothetical protein